MCDNHANTTNTTKHVMCKHVQACASMCKHVQVRASSFVWLLVTRQLPELVRLVKVMHLPVRHVQPSFFVAFETCAAQTAHRQVVNQQEPRSAQGFQTGCAVASILVGSFDQPVDGLLRGRAAHPHPRLNLSQKLGMLLVFAIKLPTCNWCVVVVVEVQHGGVKRHDRRRHHRLVDHDRQTSRFGWFSDVIGHIGWFGVVWFAESNLNWFTHVMSRCTNPSV
jgi:hypothetical protein